MKKTTTKKKFSVYKMVTDRIIASLEDGVIPWRKPWDGSNGIPRSWDGHIYRGVNALVSQIVCWENDWQNPIFLTKPKAFSLGARVISGEKSTPITLWRILVPKEYKGREEECPDEEKKWVFRYYPVYNVEQCLDLPDLPLKADPNPDLNPIHEAEGIVYEYEEAPGIQHGGGRACYSPSKDKVHIPTPKSFKSDEEYYATLFHELIHSTGHQKRLNRPDLTESMGKGSPGYAREELTAEIGASFLCSTSGISTLQVEENTTAYLQSWLSVLKSDSRLIVKASKLAEEACEHILGSPRN